MMRFFKNKAVAPWEYLLFVAIFASISTSALAQTAEAPRPDQIELASGSVLFGEIKGASGGKLSFRSTNVGLITASFNDITHLRSDNPTVIKFMDGRVIRVTELDLTRAPFDVITESGVQQYSLVDIDVINPEDWLLGRGIHKTGKLSLAYAIETGNTESSELDVDLKASWANLSTRWKFQAFGELDTDHNEKTKDKYTIIFKSDRFLSNTTHFGARALFESDKFSELVRRDVFGFYHGRQWYTSPKFNFLLEPGIAFVNESRLNENREQFPGFTWTFDIKSRLLGGSIETEIQQLGLWNLTNTSDLTLYTLLATTYPLTNRLGLVGRLVFDYDSGVPDDVEKLDNTFKLGLSYTW
jgi:putative salt-induced outer membrane protein YdiY